MILNNQWEMNVVHLLAVHDHPRISNKTLNNLESLPCSHLSLALGQSIQPLEHRFDVVLSQKLLRKFLCVALSQVPYEPDRNSLYRPSLTCLVARARVERSSSIIFTRTFVTAGVRRGSVA
jgi:hypothetical protein